MRLSDLLALDRIDPSLKPEDKPGALKFLAELLARGTQDVSVEQIFQTLQEREALASTGVGDEVAIPHGKIVGLRSIVAAMAVAPEGVEFDSIDRRPVRIFFAILAPQSAATDHLRALARCSKLLRSSEVRDQLVNAATSARILEIVDQHSAFR